MALRKAWPDASTVEGKAFWSPPDGGALRLRASAPAIANHGWDYDQSGIVVTVGHERDSPRAAPKEHFLPARTVCDSGADRGKKTLVPGVDRNSVTESRAHVFLEAKDGIPR